MFGLDLVSIIAAAIGGGAGAALGAFLTSIFKAPRLRVALVAGLTAAGAALSHTVITPVIEQFAGPTLRAGQFDTTYQAEVAPALKKIPALERIFREHPDMEAQFREKARQAYEAGGANGLM